MTGFTHRLFLLNIAILPYKACPSIGCQQNARHKTFSTEYLSSLSMRFCIYHLRVDGCKRGPVCKYPHKMGASLQSEYKSKVEEAKKNCPQCNVDKSRSSANKRKADSPASSDDRGGKKQKVYHKQQQQPTQKEYHNVILVKNTKLMFSEDNVPVEVECQIVGLGDRNIAGDIIKTEQVSARVQSDTRSHRLHCACVNILSSECKILDVFRSKKYQQPIQQ